MEKVRLGGTKFGNLLIDDAISKQRKKMLAQNWSFCAFYTNFWPFCAFSVWFKLELYGWIFNLAYHELAFYMEHPIAAFSETENSNIL